MRLISRGDVTNDEMQALARLVESLPEGDLREFIAYMHDALARGNDVVIGVIEGGHR